MYDLRFLVYHSCFTFACDHWGRRNFPFSRYLMFVLHDPSVNQWLKATGGFRREPRPVQHLEIAITEFKLQTPFPSWRQLPFPKLTILFCYYLPWSRWLPLVNVLTLCILVDSCFTSPPTRQDAGHDFAFEMPEEVCKPKPQAEVPQADVVFFGEKMFPLAVTPNDLKYNIKVVILF